MKIKLRYEKTIKILALMFLIVILFTSISQRTTYARYISQFEAESEVGVVKFGTINLVEKLDGEIQDNKTNTVSIEKEFVIGENINKEVYLEYEGSEVSTYLFLVIKVDKWNYNNDRKEFGIFNNDTRLMYFNINNIWTYVDNLSSDTEKVFYYDYDVLNDKNNKFEIMNQIYLGMIGYDDLNLIKDNKLNFKIYSIQKNNKLDIATHWSYLQ